MFSIFTDQLSIKATSDDRVIGERGSVQLTITARGVNRRNFVYKWRRRVGTFSERVHGINTTTLTIHNALVSDGAQYYCLVTNEWGNSVMTGDIKLTVKGMLYILVKQKKITRKIGIKVVIMKKTV